MFCSQRNHSNWDSFQPTKSKRSRYIKANLSNMSSIWKHNLSTYIKIHQTNYSKRVNQICFPIKRCEAKRCGFPLVPPGVATIWALRRRYSKTSGGSKQAVKGGGSSFSQAKTMYNTVYCHVFTMYIFYVYILCIYSICIYSLYLFYVFYVYFYVYNLCIYCTYIGWSMDMSLVWSTCGTKFAHSKWQAS